MKTISIGGKYSVSSIKYKINENSLQSLKQNIKRDNKIDEDIYQNNIELGLSYDDVLLVPQRSSINSRKDVSTETWLTRNIKLKIPIVSANMDTVTESEMSIKMAQLGGIGIIHRFNTIEEQVKHVRRVKRYSNAIIENPITIKYNKKIKDAKELMRKNHITSLLVVDDKNKLIGILTSRDIRFNPSDETFVSKLMTKKQNLIVAQKGVDIEEAKYIMLKNKIEKLPLVSDINPKDPRIGWTIAGLITGKDIHRREKYPDASLDEKHRLLVGAAIGVKAEDLERAEALVDAGVDVLVIDIAHGHSDLAINMIKNLKNILKTKYNAKYNNLKNHNYNNYKVDIIAGNVATPEGVRDLIEAGADGIKVGVGPGSICTTRIVTGSGYPQLSAVMNCSREADKYRNQNIDE